MYNLEEYGDMNCHQIFSLISKHQLEALMFHEQMAEYFSFLNYSGYICMHEHMLIEETKGHLKTKRFYTEHYNKILQDTGAENPKVIPSEWYSREQKDANDSVKIRAVKEGLQAYHNWEKHTVELYQQCVKHLLNSGHILAAEYVTGLAKDAFKEVKEIEGIILNLTSVDYDMTYILSSQRMLKEKYKSRD